MLVLVQVLNETMEFTVRFGTELDYSLRQLR